MGDHCHIVFSYEMLNIKTCVQAHCYDVKASSKHAICVSYFPLTSYPCVELLIYSMVLSEHLAKNPLTGKENNQPATSVYPNLP